MNHQLLVRARSEDRRAVLPELLAEARDPWADPERAARSAAGAVVILHWLGRFTEALEVTETVLRHHGRAASGPADLRLPLDLPILAAAYWDGVPAAESIRRVRASIPAGSLLDQQLAWQAGVLDEYALTGLMPDPPVVGAKEGPLSERESALLARPYGSLDSAERDALWLGLERGNRFETACALQPMGLPDRYHPLLWLIGRYLEAEDLPAAEEVMLYARDSYLPFDDWDLLPASPAVQPLLRPGLTPRVLEAYLGEPLLS